MSESHVALNMQLPACILSLPVALDLLVNSRRRREFVVSVSRRRDEMESEEHGLKRKAWIAMKNDNFCKFIYIIVYIVLFLTFEAALSWSSKLHCSELTIQGGQ